MSTVQDLLYMTLRLAGVTQRPGWTPNADKFNDAKQLVNLMLGQWNLGRMIYTSGIAVWPLTAGLKSYTIGPGGAIDTTRPEKITGANILFPTSPVVRREIRATDDDSVWRAISVQDISGGVPAVVYNDGGAPLSTLYLHPQPGTGYSLELYTWTMLAALANLGDTVTLPPGYEDAIVHNGAVRVATAWGFPVHPDIRNEAVRSRAAVIGKNARAPRMPTDPALKSKSGGHYNWLNGTVE